MKNNNNILLIKIIKLMNNKIKIKIYQKYHQLSRNIINIILYYNVNQKHNNYEIKLTINNQIIKN